MTKEEATKILKDFHDKSALFSVRTALETLYPELKESEDEKIIKILQEGVNDVLQDQFCTNRGVSKEKVLSWLEKQGEQKPADTVEQKCEESKTKIFDAPTPFEDKLYAFVAACEFLAIPSKIEFILEHSQEILDAAKEQIGKEQSSAWSEEDEKMLQGIWDEILANKHDAKECEWKTYDKFLDWLKSLKPQNRWKPSDEQLKALKNAIHIKPFKNPSDSILWGLYEQLNKLKS